MFEEELLPCPCKHGELLEHHAVYCNIDELPTKCPIYKWHGLGYSAWHSDGDFMNDDNWESGCKYFENNEM